ncbi:hypothetical protein L3X38_025426 [Prunus dulcis]|uniref:Uncharacterized protein n=1 Tax=Prunus dulcis TaxID=3755 RepID=A0AAD4W2T2_PRUDU|nr:hypothetical protein L3X38_025426 [Prunus dulcis]
MQPTRRHMRWHRVGGLINSLQPKILHTASPNSYPTYNTLFGTTFVLGPTSKNNRKWPESHPEIWPNFGLQIKLPTLEIDQILPNHQLEHIERRKNIPNSKKMVVGGVRTSFTKFREKLSKLPCFVVVSGDHDGGLRLRWAGTRRGKCDGSNGTGLPSIGGRS